MKRGIRILTLDRMPTGSEKGTERMGERSACIYLPKGSSLEHA